MSDDVLDQAAERLAQKFHAAYERLAPSFGYETREASARPWSDVPDPNRSLMIAVAGEVLSEAPVPAVDDHPTLATLLCDITGLGPETWPVVCDVTVIELAERLIAAGYVRTGPVVSHEVLAQVLCSKLADLDFDGDTVGIADLLADALLAADVVRGTAPDVSPEQIDQAAIAIREHMHSDPQTRREAARAAFRATGYVVRGAAVARVLEECDRCERGGTMMAPSIIRSLIATELGVTDPVLDGVASGGERQ